MRRYKRKMLHTEHILDCWKLVESLGLASETIPDTSPLICPFSQEEPNNSSEAGSSAQGLWE
jgi:hypothetical protein